jgi:hypothetical protein
MTRAYIPLKVKLASALLTIKRPDDTGKLVPVIPHEQAKTMTAEQIISKFHFNHHPIPHAYDGPDEPWNLDPEPAESHREITAKIDIPRIAKSKRVITARAAHAEALTAKVTGERVLSRDKPGKRQWPKGRKMQSRNSFEKRTPSNVV